MVIPSRGLLILLFLAMAIVFYATGFRTGMIALITIGAIFELLFWLKLFKR